MSVSLSEHFTYKKLFIAVLPSIFMMVFTSIYSIVDGFFISNYVGNDAFASVNLIMPVVMIFSSLGFMMGTGGSALVAKTLGEGDNEKANKLFSMVMYFTFLLGVVVSVIGFVFTKQIAILLGATSELLDYCVIYGKILIGTNFMFMLQNAFQSMFMVAEKPLLGFLFTCFGGVTNIILDALFVAVFKWGLVGAAVATVCGYFVGGVVPIFYFACAKNKSLLHLSKAKIDFRQIRFACFNGSSELVSQISASVVGMLFNMQLLKLAGTNGVSAYGVIMYAGFIFAAIFIGYSVGTAPIVGYHYGAGNHSELKNLLRKSMVILIVCGVIMTALTEVLARPLSSIFTNGDTELLDLTVNGMRLYGISFLIFGINIFASSFFTALNNGLVSALISFIRTLFFQVITILIMPVLFGITGVWLSVVVAEVLSLIVSVVFLITQKKKYKY